MSVEDGYDPERDMTAIGAVFDADPALREAVELEAQYGSPDGSYSAIAEAVVRSGAASVAIQGAEAAMRGEPTEDIEGER